MPIEAAFHRHEAETRQGLVEPAIPSECPTYILRTEFQQDTHEEAILVATVFRVVK